MKKFHDIEKWSSTESFSSTFKENWNILKNILQIRILEYMTRFFST